MLKKAVERTPLRLAPGLGAAQDQLEASDGAAAFRALVP